MTDADDRLDLLGIRRQQNRERHHAKVGQAVALIGVKPFLGADESTVTNDGTESVEKFCVHGAATEKNSTRLAERESTFRQGRDRKRGTPLVNG